MKDEYNINRTTFKILGLFRNDYNTTLHVREIARRTQVDVKATGLQLKRLGRRNILLSRRKGRNIEYSLNLKNLPARYFIALAEVYSTVEYLANNFTMKKVLGELEKSAEDEIFVLFGSFAKGNANKTSDIDLFVVTNRKSSRILTDAREAGIIVGRQISIKRATVKQFADGLQHEDPLTKEVVSNHIVLKGIDRFCDMMWRYHERQ